VIIRSIAVEAWGPYVRRTALEDLAEGINVIAGPNETGKSTLARAIARGLLDRNSVTGQDIEAIRPWGRDLGPRVEIVFEHGGARYRLTKRFLKDPSCALEREEGGRYAPLADGDGAEERVRALLGATLPGRGLTKAEHWGIGQVLWAPQGEIHIDDISAGAEERLRRTLGAVAAGAEGGRIEERIDEAYGKLFTPTGKPRGGRDAPAFVKLAEDVKKLDAELAAGREEAEAFAAASRTVLAKREERERLTREREERSERLRAIEADAKRCEEIDRERAKIEGELRAKEAEYKALKAKVDEIAALRVQANERAGEIERIAGEIPGIEAAIAAAEVERDARRLAALRGDAAKLDGRIERLRETARALAEKGEARAKVVAPSREDLARLRKLLTARDQARIRLESCAIFLEIEPERDIDVETPGADGPRPIHAGESFRVSGIGGAEARIPGVVRIRARGSTPPPEEIRRALDEAEARIRTQCGPYGTSEVEALEELCRRAEALDAEIRTLEADRRTVLDGRSEDELLRDLDEAKEEARAILVRRPEWTDAPPEADEDARAAKEAAAALEKDRASLAAAQARRQALEAERERIEGRRRAIEADGLDDAARARLLGDLALATHALTEARAAKQAEIDAFPEDPRRARDRIRAEIDRIAAAERAAIDAESQAKGILDEKVRKGIHDRVARIEEARADAGTRWRRERIRAEAIRLLRETILHARETLVTDLVAPVEREVARTMMSLVGPRYDQVRIGTGFLPCGIAAGEQAIGIDALSYGTEEQLFFLVRLALAKAIASEGRETLILDDPLVNTDPERMARALPIIEEAAGTLQVLLFTCHPERYEGLTATKRYDLAVIARG